MRRTSQKGSKKKTKLSLEKICLHCKGNLDIRNPKKFCDHLYYPESCKICFKRVIG